MEKQLRAIYLEGEEYINADDVEVILKSLEKVTHRSVVYSGNEQIESKIKELEDSNLELIKEIERLTNELIQTKKQLEKTKQELRFASIEQIQVKIKELQ